MGRFLYHIITGFYFLSIRIASLFNQKAKAWQRGRLNLFDALKNFISNTDKKIIWIHCASLGEFEQGKSLMELFEQNDHEYELLVTFFSPSGYEIIRKKYPKQNIFYLPKDSASNARKFLDVVKPSIAIFIKYEFWFHFLNQLNQKKIPCFLVAATFRKEQLFFSPFGKFYLKILGFFDQIFVQDTASMRLLKQYNIDPVHVMGDPRIDQVITNKKSASEAAPAINSLSPKNQYIVFGSVWPEDYHLIKHFIERSKAHKIIIAPHEIDTKSISNLIRYFGNQGCLLYSHLEAGVEEPFDILIIDNIGLLKYLYRIGNMAYIGGGFGKGIHNILEAAIYGIPILFGPKYHKFNEAKDLIELSCAYSVSDTYSLDNSLSKIKEKGADYYKNQLNSYFERHQHASSRIYHKIHELCIKT